MKRRVGMSAKIVNALRSAEGRFVSTDDLMFAMYGGEDEPDYIGLVPVFVSKLRKLGFPIENWHSIGYRWAAHGVVEAEAADIDPRTPIGAVILGRPWRPAERRAA